MKNKKIAIIGHFGGNENILDGQTIKTKILYDELKNATDWNIRKVDTYYKSKKPIKLLIESIITLVSTRDVIVLLSGNGMKFYFPILSFFAMVFKTRIYHDVIGGNLNSYVKKYPKFKDYLNSYEVNWVETESLKKYMIECGVINCEVIPNFKRLSITDVECGSYNVPFKFCIFSRVMKEKGVEIAIKAIEEINASAGKIVCNLDIYGRIDDGYKDDFTKLMKSVTSAIKYKGMVPYDKSTETIRGYYSLLFPTFWKGEGFPGTIIDAFSAGIPVIATDWNCNGEIVVNGVNGVLYPNDHINNLREAIEWMISNQEAMIQMKKECRKSAQKFQPDEYIKQIVSRIFHESN